MAGEIQLLAPGGDLDSIKAAVAAGADAVYCGLDRFNARNRAANIRFEDLNGVLRLAHKHGCQVFLTLNIIIVESELPAVIRLLNKLVNTTINGVIVQDLGLLHLLSRHFPSVEVHASTQLTTHNEGQVRFLKELAVTRANLCRELTIDEIRRLTSAAHANGLGTEVFVHGSYCICFSGICYMSSVHGGNSGNRGRCSQPCRARYVTTPKGIDFPLNLRDNSAYFELKALSDAGVDSLKIEGRMKEFHYVYTVVDSFRKQLRNLSAGRRLSTDNSELHKVFNRDFSAGFLRGSIGKEMFINDPMNHAAIHLSEMSGETADGTLDIAEAKLLDEKTRIVAHVRDRIEELSVSKAPVTVTLSGKRGAPLEVSVRTPETSFVVRSQADLRADSGSRADEGTAGSLNRESLMRKFQSIDDTEYVIKDLDLVDLQGGLSVPFGELNSIRKRILFVLNGSKDAVDPVDVPAIGKPGTSTTKPALSVLISSQADLDLCSETAAVYFQLPSSFGNRFSELTELFTARRELVPWFPSILIGEDYRTAVEFLEHVQPELVVTNNTGVAHEARKRGIAWLAGPYLNLANSYSLVCLKERFDCSGAFISNELSRRQIGGIKSPGDFKMLYSIYHPILLMTSRQCLFHQVTGCEKDGIDAECVPVCGRSSSITNLDNGPVHLEKRPGNYHCLYNNRNFLNTDIVTDMPGRFSRFMIDLRDIRTGTQLEMGKAGIIRLFEEHLNGTPDAGAKLKQAIRPTVDAQYRRGI
ncbi:MAG: U32 family peptidase [Lentisphaerae bacterium]|jgi:U32 family peptidase|nr:U32 family peptidase [Lentisphaerota bacterium]MBT4814708.1 U32 family peptidase [Lentisphaerota bacterium]MBT5611790.1 U32 family peptidase [Lentisphaerota bacterium]MBT7056946.1 U32 family peptidase [Lentisphaerota bacterium]MBT7845836.1 U32 family peptidase [Lentisphaerota bacterium]